MLLEDIAALGNDVSAGGVILSLFLDSSNFGIEVCLARGHGLFEAAHVRLEEVRLRLQVQHCTLRPALRLLGVLCGCRELLEAFSGFLLLLLTELALLFFLVLLLTKRGDQVGDHLFDALERVCCLPGRLGLANFRPCAHLHEIALRAGRHCVVASLHLEVLRKTTVAVTQRFDVAKSVAHSLGQVVATSISDGIQLQEVHSCSTSTLRARCQCEARRLRQALQK
mmetsp:Transcript_88539/g.211388  ORF Transcript_88539/g.211388 Transcript_88539/m.211388 type:complete len:225 (-) Transcript_88539:1152-1826(-)